MNYFWMMVVLGCGVVLLRRRGFDVVALAIASSIIYFIPGLFGFGFFVESEVPYVSILSPETYTCMAIVIGALIACALAYDAAGKLRARVLVRWNFKDDELAGEISLLVACGALVATLATIGPEALAEQKKLFIHELGYTYWAFEIFASLSVLIAFAQRKFRLMVAGILLLVVDLVLGFRLGAITTALGMLLLATAQATPQRLLGRWGLLLGLGLCFFAALIWKELISGMKEGLMSGDFTIFVNVISTPISYADAFFRSEPFVTTTILNEVIRNHYELPLAHLTAAFSIALPFVSSLDLAGATSGALFQRDLFPEVQFGMAHNIWAQMYALGGLSAVAVYGVLFGLVVLTLQLLIRRSGGSLAAFLALTASYWAFYSHRNDFFYQLILQRRILFAFGAALVCSVFIKFLLSRIPAGKPRFQTDAQAS